ncbi:hypothetical protein BJX99DRAFT_235828 [Aspergillus californicus]
MHDTGYRLIRDSCCPIRRRNCQCLAGETQELIDVQCGANEGLLSLHEGQGDVDVVLKSYGILYVLL